MSFTFFGPNQIKSIGAFSAYTYVAGFSSVSNYTFSSLLDRDRGKQFSITLGAGGSSITALEATLNDSPVCDMLAIQNITLATAGATLIIWINSTTVNPSNHATNTSQWATIDDNTIIRFPATAVSTVTLLYHGGISYGQVMLGAERLELPKNPVFSEYKPMLDSTLREYRMSDGGFVSYKIHEKFSGQVTLKFVSPTATTDLLAMYQTSGSWDFCPYPTNTAWDGDIYNCIWSGKYEFKTPSYDNRSDPYYNGKIVLKETPV